MYLALLAVERSKQTHLMVNKPLITTLMTPTLNSQMQDYKNIRHIDVDASGSNVLL
jgi:hypothetical protein